MYKRQAMKRSIITTDGNGNIIMPTDISATAMSEWELCEDVYKRQFIICKGALMRVSAFALYLPFSEEASIFTLSPVRNMLFTG